MQNKNYIQHKYDTEIFSQGPKYKGQILISNIVEWNILLFL